MHLEFPIKPKPRLAQWLFDRDIPRSEFAERMRVKPQQISQWCAAFDSPYRSIPTEEQLGKIHELTGGQITPADFYPPHLRGEVMPASPAAQPEPVQ